MAIFLFSGITAGSVVPFNPAVDQLIFDDVGITAAAAIIVGAGAQTTVSAQGKRFH